MRICVRQYSLNFSTYLSQVRLQRLHVLELPMCLCLLDERLNQGLLLKKRLQCARNVGVGIDLRRRFGWW